MLTTEEIRDTRKSVVNLEDVLFGRLRLEDIEGYFKRERKENLLAQGYPLPPELDNPDDEFVPFPEHLRERPDPDTRSRYQEGYDGGEYEEVPHYGTHIYLQWKSIKEGRFSYLRTYGFSGEEIRISKRIEGWLIAQVREFLLSTVSNPITNSERNYQWFQVRREDLDIRNEKIAFVTCYLFPKN